MSWPTPSETFCVRDVKSLIALGNDLSVFGLKPEISKKTKLRENFEVNDIPGGNLSLANYFLGFCLLLLKGKSTFLVTRILLKNLNNPKVLIKSFGLLPSCYYYLNLFKKNNFEVIHLFWGHYPSVLGHLIKINKLPVKLSMFLGAYDMTQKLEISKELTGI